MTRTTQHVVLRISIALLIALALTNTVEAQKPKPGDKLSANGLRKDIDTFVKSRYTRLAEDAFRALVVEPAADASEADRMLHWVQAGKWRELGEFLKLFEPDIGQRIHSKIISDLAYSQPKATILPQDVLALADASPVEIDDRQIGHLSGLLRIATRDTESRSELLAALHTGTARLGGTDLQRRRIAARILAGADLWTEAKTFGIPERELRAGVVAAVAEPETTAAPQLRTWEQVLAVLRNNAADETARATALADLHQLILSATPQLIEQHLKPVLSDRSRLELARNICGMIGRETAAAGREVDFSARAVHLDVQKQAMSWLAATVSLDQEPWLTMANLYANNWLQEAQFSVKTFPNWLKTSGVNRDRLVHVPIERVIQDAPSGAWMSVLLPQLATTIKTTTARLILLSDDIDRTIPYVRELVRSDGPSAAKLANAYLETWAARHDPNLTPELLRQYKLDNQVVVLTRAQQEASLRQLGELLSSLDEPTRKLLDEVQLVRAFDFCHSRAEVYTREHLVEVFGPLEQVSPTLVLALFERMRGKLASQWRDLTVQRDAATRRTSADVFLLVNQGYAEAARIAEAWLAAHADDWRMNCTAGALLSDWSEFAYFQSVASDDGGDRFATYLQHSEQALKHFRAGSNAYAALVPRLKRSEFELLPYRSWFYGLLGITHDSGVNLRKGLTREGLDELRQALLDLPGGAAEVHLELFSSMVADNVSANLIAPEMKYRYLSSAVQITGRRPTVYPAEEKIKYYDSLLKEIRLQARLDGSDQIRAPGVFGVFVSLVHTADVARESGGFGKYVMNEVQRTVSGKTITEKPLYRDRFEESLRVALADFFEVRAIVFADPKAGSRVLKTSGDSANVAWQETPLAYLLLATKDVTVDRVPALEIELDFFDRTGKVVIPVPSNPIQIALAADAPAQRPAKNVALTQIADSRELADKRLKIDVIATAQGIVPDLESLLQLDGYALTVEEVSDKEGLLVRELHTTQDELYVVSERSWTVHLDPGPLLRGASHQVEFEFPQPKSSETAVSYRRYQDLDPVEAAAKFTLVEGDDVAKVAQVDYRLWGAVGAGLLALVVLVIYLLRKQPADSSAVPPLFELPREYTPFSVAALLHRIGSSPQVQLSAEQHTSLRGDIHTLEQGAFGRDATSLARQELESLARRWLERGLSSAAT